MPDITALALNQFTGAVQNAANTVFGIYDTWKSTQAHPKADQWVALVQNPFGAQLSLIVDSKDAAIAAGTVTADDVYFAQQAVIQIWAGYRSLATEFAKGGPLYAEVINGSYDTLQPLITSILSKMDVEIAQLGGVSVSARLGVNTSHFRLAIWVVVLFVVALLVYRRPQARG